MSASTLAGRLRSAREMAGLSQGQAAKMMSMHRPTISEIEADRRKVSAEEVQKFSGVYGVTVEWLVNGRVGGAETDSKLLLAARELSKMSEDDLTRLMDLLHMLRGGQ